MRKSSNWEGRQVGPYGIEKRLGAGGMGAVYRAHDGRLGRPVALKQILPEALGNERARRRFRREARSAARLNHPGIVKVHDLLHHEGCDWIVMELVEGETLSRLLSRGALPPQRAVALAAQIADALAAAHAEGVVHRDLKARNLLVTGDRVKILDFGLAKQVMRRDGKSTSLSLEGQLLGTPHAMSPEQAMGRKVDLRSDLFSLGSLLYEMLTGEAPFRADDPVETITRVCSYHPPSLRERPSAFPPALCDLVDRLLEKDPAHRPRSAEEVAHSLRRLGDRLSFGLPQEAAPGKHVEDATVATSLGSSSGNSRAERRQVTVLCCELVGPCGASGSLDPEALYRASAALESLVRKVAERWEGHVTTVLGHRVVISFGYPRAHEDDARRAVDAALVLAARGRDLSASTERSQDLGLRIGIHTGPAVVLGSATGEAQMILGRTLDLARGLQKSSPPGHVLLSDATRPLIAGTHRTEACEPVEMDGFPEPVTTFRALEAKDASTWQATAQLTPLVAREQELAVLRERWRLADAGQGQVVLLAGEAGIGKSRLLHALKTELRDEGAAWRSAYGSSQARSSPLHPITQLVRRTFRLDNNTPKEAQLDRLAEGSARYGFAEGDVVPLLAALLALPFEDRYPPLGLRPQKQREKTLEALAALFVEMARRERFALVIEDLHWADPSTLELLDLLIERGERSSLFLLLSYRPEFDAVWGNQKHLTRLHLNRLAGAQVSALINHVTGGRALPAAVHDQIVAKTDGVPLFVEELTKNVLESGHLLEKDGGYELTGSLADLAIPATLRDSLTARLDRLGAAKEVAQLAATIGRKFSYPLLAAVSPLAETALAKALERLMDAELIHRKGFSAKKRYLFKHALIQDTAYESLLKSDRQRHHGEIAQILEGRFPQTAQSQPELLAHHYTEAGLVEAATVHWEAAGNRDRRRSAYREANAHYKRGLAAVAKTAEGSQRTLTELKIWLGLYYSLSAAEKASPEVAEALDHAQRLASGMEPCEEVFRLEELLWRTEIYRNVPKALEHSQRLARLAQSNREIHVAERTLGMTCFYLGELREARVHLETALLHHSGNPTNAILSLVLMSLGYLDQARDRSQQAIASGRGDPEHRYSVALLYGALVSLACGESRTALARIGELLTLSQETDSDSQRVGEFWTGILAHLDGKPKEAGDSSEHRLTDPENEARRLWQAYERSFSSGLGLARTESLASFIAFCLKLGRVEDGRRAMKKALAVVAETGEHHVEGELHRLRGELTLSTVSESGTDLLNRQSEAESAFRQALEIARRQNAKLLELQTAVSLSRLWRIQGRRDEARDLLSGVYGWFHEGLDTAHLREAKELLAELS